MKPAMYRWNSLISACLACLVLCLIVNPLPAGADAPTSTAAPSTISVLLNDQELPLGTDPLIEKDTTFVPMKPLFHALGITLEWDAVNKTVQGKKDDLAISLTIGSKEAWINSMPYQLAEPAMLRDSFTLVPLRFISEATDALVLWQPYLKQVYIYEAAFLEQNQLTKAQITDNFNQYLAESLAEYEKQKEKWEQEQAKKEEDQPDTGTNTDSKPNPGMCSVWRYHPMYEGSLEWVPCP